MMIKNTTFLRRAVGSLLIALVTLVGLQANAQLDFSVSSEYTWNEEDLAGGTSLSNLQSRVTDAIASPIPDGTCYVVTHSHEALEIPAASRNCRPDGETPSDSKPGQGITTDPGAAIVLVANKHVDYDVRTGGAPSQTLTVTAYAAKKKTGELTVAIKGHRLQRAACIDAKCDEYGASLVHDQR